jgi:uncharacterized cupredoxin-like copper-binding protein
MTKDIMKPAVLFAALFALGSLPAGASEQEEHEHGMTEHEHMHEHMHGHEAAFSAGESGNPKEPSREIDVTMKEFRFEPGRIEVHKGEQVRFVLHNSGQLDHEFVLATPEENREHAKEMAKNPEMQHKDPNARRVAPGQTEEMIWKFTNPGEFQYACLIPGHFEAGMFGTVEVK